MNKEKIENAKLFIACKKQAVDKIKTCYHPNCSEKSINSHILQKNGILSAIATDRHLWEFCINPYKSPSFQPQRTGINDIFSFNCFCNKHDKDLFSKIEKQDIDFEDYNSCLLFIVRAFYNEFFRKEVGIYQFECLIEKSKNEAQKRELRATINQLKLGIKDLDFQKSQIWNDIENNTQSFVFKVRKIEKIDLIMASFYDYETTNEVSEFRFINGDKEMERLSSIFVTLFPYKDKSILLMGYSKVDETKVKGHFNLYFNESEKRIQRKLTNLVLFQCETWACSDKFYRTKIKGNEVYISNAAYFSQRNFEERKVFDVNIFRDDFRDKIIKWNNEYCR